MQGSRTNRELGFSVAELVVAIAIGMVILAAVTATFIAQSKYFNAQEQINQMQQNARGAMDIIVREVKMAGYNPTHAAFNGITYDSSKLNLLSDFSGPSSPEGDGNLNQPNENITYSFDATNLRIMRNDVNGSGSQVLASNIQNFTFSYLDANGNPTTTTANIRQIQIVITARTSKPDPSYPSNGGYRTYQLTALVTPSNLGY